MTATPDPTSDALDVVLKRFADDPETDAIVMIGEIGGTAEEEAAAWAAEHLRHVPKAAFIAGRTAPEGKRVCDAYGIPVPKEGVASTPAQVSTMPKDDRNIIRVNRLPAVGLGIVKQSTANTLAVAQAQNVAAAADELWLCRGDLGAEMGLRGMAAAAHRFAVFEMGINRPGAVDRAVDAASAGSLANRSSAQPRSTFPPERITPIRARSSPPVAGLQPSPGVPMALDAPT